MQSFENACSSYYDVNGVKFIIFSQMETELKPFVRVIHKGTVCDFSIEDEPTVLNGACPISKTIKAFIKNYKEVMLARWS